MPSFYQLDLLSKNIKTRTDLTRISLTVYFTVFFFLIFDTLSIRFEHLLRINKEIYDFF